MSQSQKKTLRLLVGILIVLVVILAVVMAVRHFSAQKVAEEEEAAK